MYNKYNKTIKPISSWVLKLHPETVVHQKPNNNEINHWMRCDSALETETYQLLRTTFNANQIIRDYPLLIKPPTSRYKQLTWKCDFAIRAFVGDDIIYFVECKGICTEKFSLQLQLLEYFSWDDFCKLLIVSKTANLKIPGKTVLKLKELLQQIGK